MQQEETQPIDEGEEPATENGKFELMETLRMVVLAERRSLLGLL